MSLLDTAVEAYGRAHLPISHEKSFRMQPNFVAWGSECKSERGTVGAPLERRLQLMVLTMLALLRPALKQAHIVLNRRIAQSMLGDDGESQMVVNIYTLQGIPPRHWLAKH